ncbi:MAG TPA: glycoside hydrolase family 38 C-terminal domain-containing protein [Tepidisphaeraceae bacterium]|jgi:alpha-mannosidase|nr:glycoside hydrolase family 38 C-terminal domain-containing protein [Tepidisphaeraceae bacterium]
MTKRSFILAGVTHVDLAWKWGAAEMTEMLEVVAVRLLDALDSDPTFKYTLEQVAPYRVLARSRPDLVRRLGEHVRAGRLEMAGCMASTLDTNVPNGESYVRNQLLGIRWVRENWDVEPRTGWLMDTFGINAQVPQILRQFGLRHLVGSRFGGDKRHDAFTARGLDGSQITVIGRDVHSLQLQPRYGAIACCRDWRDLDALFAEADALPGDGPFLVQPLTENELLISLRPYRDAGARNVSRDNEMWTIGTYADFFEQLDRLSPRLPIEHADLNPEFTGCFSLRPTLRLRNRRAEALLIDAEKWACFAGPIELPNLADAWWDMSFVQFHDVFTGSHPTHVYHDVLATLDRIDDAAMQGLLMASQSLLAKNAADDVKPVISDAGTEMLLLFNGLPWQRRSPVELTGIKEPQHIIDFTDSRGEAVAFEMRGDALVVAPATPACGAAALRIRRAAPPTAAPAATAVESTVLENEYLSVHLTAGGGIEQIVWKPTGRVLVEAAGGLLVAQRDDGNFQIESPNGCEVPAIAGTLTLQRVADTALGRCAVLQGAFPKLAWAGPDALLQWSIELSLPFGSPSLRVDVRFDWKGEGTRVRLRLPTTIDSAAAIYEVPFGTVSRRPYGVRDTARGEWPAQRFVLLQDGSHGVALANNGAPGVEVLGGAIITSLVRAPKAVYAGMMPDDTSSGHGRHRFQFEVVPFEGDWETSAVLRVAQELNAPAHVVDSDANACQSDVPSQLSLEPSTVVLSTVKRPEDGVARAAIVRVYESVGRATDVVLRIPAATSAQRTDLREWPGDVIPIVEGAMRFHIRPFEIVTLRVRMFS